MLALLVTTVVEHVLVASLTNVPVVRTVLTFQEPTLVTALNQTCT